MTKQVNVDVGASVAFNKANGRLKPADTKEIANYNRKTYVCQKCGTHYMISLKEFGEEEVCPKCKVPMMEKL
jgi:rubrerythrin